MSAVVFEGEPIGLSEGESILDALLREGHQIPNGCRSGVCQSCLLSAEEGESIAHAQMGLSEAQKQLNYFLSCQCALGASLENSIKIRRVDTAATQIDGVVTAKEWLNDHVLLVKIKADLNFRPGQFVTLWKDQTLSRSYSLASTPQADGVLQFHIRHYSNGQFSSWVANELNVGDTIGVQGPLGKCIYTPCGDQPMLLACIGTGLAPIWGILLDALSNHHAAPIMVVIGAKDRSHLYMLEQLREVVEGHDNVSLHLVCQNDLVLDELTSCNDENIVYGDVYQFCADEFSSLKGYRVFLCGAESFVAKLRKQCFMAGANMKEIKADPFIPFGG